MSNANEIVISERAQKQLRDLLETIEKLNEQINTYVAALGAGLDVPDGWQLDVRRMAFVAPVVADAPVMEEGPDEG